MRKALPHTEAPKARMVRQVTHFTNHAHNEMPLATVRSRSLCSTLSPKEGVSHITLPLTPLYPIFPCPWFAHY